MSKNRKMWLSILIAIVIVGCLMTFILHWVANNLIPDVTIRQAFSDLFIPMYIGTAFFLGLIALINCITDKNTK